MKIYLAHPLESKDYVRTKELILEELYKVELVNPFYDIESEIVDTNATREERYEFPFKPIVEGDLEAIKNCDALIAVIDGKFSIGTFMEIRYAHGELKKPTCVLCTSGHDQHPWLRYNSDLIVTDWDELENFLDYIKLMGL